jgi:hypothetical protein
MTEINLSFIVFGLSCLKAALRFVSKKVDGLFVPTLDDGMEIIMNRIFNFFCLFLLCIVLSGCSSSADNNLNAPEASSEANQSEAEGTAGSNEEGEVTPEATPASEPKVIKVWSKNGNEMPEVINKFRELHPDFEYDIEVTDYSGYEGNFHKTLENALAEGGPDAPDIYCIEAYDIMNYTQGELYPYAADYKDLGIDVDSLLKEAAIAKYTIDIGTNPEGKLVALGYQSTAAACIYRRSIAKEVWGTDVPSAIQDIIGPGWDKFFEAAEALKQKGYGITSGYEDLWHPVANSSDQSWVADGKLVIDPKREAYLDISKKLIDHEYTNNRRLWTGEWIDDMKGIGNKEIFCFIGPSWFLGSVIKPNIENEAAGTGTYGDWAVCEPPEGFLWGGAFVLANKETKYKEAVGELIKWITLDASETGLQYLIANGEQNNGIKDAVPSATVMKKSDGSMDMLGGQNLFDAYLPAADYVNAKTLTQYDETINYYWLLQVQDYVTNKKTKEQAISDFKIQVKENLDISAQ